MANYIIGEQTARKLNAMLSATTLSARRVGMAASADCDMPTPFAVAWSQQQNDGDGSWVIWLPRTDGLIVIGGTDISPTTPLSAATGMPAGWYVLDISTDATAVYLVITASEGAESVSVSYAETASTASGAKNFIIATMSASSSGGKLVKQIQVGPIRSYGTMAVDELSIDKNSSDEYEIKGWKAKAPEADSLAKSLGLTSASQSSSQEVVVRNGANGALTFVKFGAITFGVKNVTSSDQTTQVVLTFSFFDTNKNDLVVTIPKASAPNDGKLYVKFGNNSAVLKHSANTAQDSTINFATVASTGDYDDLINKPAIPTPNDGKLYVQFGTDAAVEKHSANTANNTTINFAKVAQTGDYLDLINTPVLPAGNVNFVGEIRYDTATMQLQQRIDTLNAATGAVVQGNWAMIVGGQAVPHGAS